jgi:chromosomal replication initiation ATPase DnaA
MDKTFQTRIVDAFIRKTEDTYNSLYFYGEHQHTKAMVDYIMGAYRTQYPEANTLRSDAERFRLETLRNVMAGEHYIIPACDLFIFENIDDIAGLEANEQRLYGILDWLLENNRKIVITGTSPTASIANLAPRIRAQIDGGIAYAIAACGA